ncbi:MAG: hypothetical protein K6E50_00670 [Lachnospiraceae bacterium]|nr:hypothetical protein [Lachnospiraceae bacterium]
MTLGERFDHEREEGRLGDRVEAIIELLEDIGEIPDDLRKQLNEIRDMELLKVLLKKAARAQSIADFKRELEEIMALA